MSGTALRVGVIGAGGNTRARHIPGLLAIDGVEVVAVANRSPGSTAAVADEFGIGRRAGHWSEITGASDLDAVVIGTWPDTHAELTTAALEGGKHVLCEARMARDLAEAQQMLAASQRHPGLVAQLVPAPFTLPQDATITRLLGEGYLGEVIAVDIDQRTGFIDRTSPRTWRQDTAVSGVNIMGLGIMYEAVMRWVGLATAVSATARTFVDVRPGADGPDVVDVPDHLEVAGELACGGLLRIHLSQVTGLGPTNAIHIFGSEGTLRIQDGVLAGGRRGDTALAPIAVPAGEGTGWRVEEEFVGAIRGEEPVRLTTFADGVRYMAFTEAVHRSIREQRTVAIAAQ